MESNNKFFVICGPNVIESEEHAVFMAEQINSIMNKYDVNFFFKVSFDKANRSSIESYRGPGIDLGIKVFDKIKKIGIKILTDIHEPWQAEKISPYVDIIQIPAFLCRQTDLLKAAAETGKIIHVKKGQFCTADQMHKCKEKIISFGNDRVILCERGNSFGYNDLVVDPRNLIWLRSDTNRVSMDITHCLQRPSQKDENGIVKSGGYRELIPYMGKMAIALGVDGIFLETHDNPESAMCDAPTQWPLDRLEWLLDYVGVKRNNAMYDVDYVSSSISKTIKAELGTIEKDSCGLMGTFEEERYRGEKIMNIFLKEPFTTVLDVGAGGLEHTKIFIDNGKIVDICDYGTSCYYKKRTDEKRINRSYLGDFNNINFDHTYDAVWCCHILEHMTNVGLFLKKIHKILKEDGYLCIIVPPRKPMLVGGHVSIWNAGLVIYNLILAGFDCSKYCKIKQYDYNIGIIIKKKSISTLPDITMDRGDIELLSQYFPFDVKHGTNGDILSL